MFVMKSQRNEENLVTNPGRKGLLNSILIASAVFHLLLHTSWANQCGLSKGHGGRGIGRHEYCWSLMITFEFYYSCSVQAVILWTPKNAKEDIKKSCILTLRDVNWIPLFFDKPKKIMHSGHYMKMKWHKGKAIETVELKILTQICFSNSIWASFK